MKSKKQITSDRFFKNMNKALIHFANSNKAKYLEDFSKIQDSMINVSDLLTELESMIMPPDEVKKDYCNVCGRGTYNIKIVMGQYTCPSCAKEIN